MSGAGAVMTSPTQVTGRDRNGRAVTGTAAIRTNQPFFGYSIPYFAPGGRWYPFSFGGYGPWYDAYWYDPFYFQSYGYWGYGPGYGGYGQSGGGYSEAPSHRTGSIRLKVSPDTAEVYIDGARVGTAGEFGGLISHHLVLEGGSHQLELRANGYETYSGTLVVELGKTLTERVSLKKK